MNINKPHDTFFKQLMADPHVLKDFITATFPEDIVKALDLHSLKIIDTEKANRKYKKYFLDITVQCKLLDKDSEIYIVFEHKSYPDKLTLIQFLNYFSVVWEEDIRNNRNPRPIIPVLFYHGKIKFNLPDRFIEYFKVNENFKKYLLDFSYILFDTNKYKDEEILKLSENMYLVAGLLMFKNIFRDVKEMKPVLRKVLEIGDERILMVFDYLVMAKDIEEEEFEKLIREVGGEKMASLAQRWMEKGKIEGLKRAIKIGLKLKFGQQGLILYKKIDNIKDLKILEKINEKIFIAKDINELGE